MVLFARAFSSWPLAVAVGLCLLSSASAETPVSPAPAPTATPAATPTATPAAAAIEPLGATPRQIATLYGPVLRHNARVRNHQILEGGTVIDGDLYSRNGLVIRVVYYGGVSVLLEYNMAGGTLAGPELNTLLAATAGGSTWENGKENTETNRFYRRADGKAIAHYTAEFGGSLLVAAEGPGGDFYNGKLILEH